MKKEILEKMYAGKVELSEIPVELALVDDLMKSTTELNNEYKKTEQLRKDIAVNNFNLKQSKKALLNKLNSLDTFINNTTELSNKIEQAAKDLGLSSGDVVAVAKKAIDNVKISRNADIKTYDLNNI